MKGKLQKTPTAYLYQTSVEAGELEMILKNPTTVRGALRGLLQVVFRTFTGSEYTLYLGDINLLSVGERRRAVRTMAEGAADAIDEASLYIAFEQFASRVIIEHFTSPPPQRIAPKPNNGTAFLLFPVLPKNHPTLIYAPGGTGKSFLAMYFALHVQNGIPLFNDASVEKGEALYIDWEVDKEEADRRFGMLQWNFDVELEYPLYKRGVLTLKDELEDILQIVSNHDIKLVVIDSAGPAIGGDINDAAKVIEFFQGIRQINSLGASVLILTHVSKASRREGNPTPIGSVFFENLTRLTWELRYLNHEDMHIELGLFPRKSNFGRFKPLGFVLDFDAERVSINVTVLDEDTPTTEQARIQLVGELLEASPDGRTPREISQYTGLSQQTVADILTKLKESGKAYLDPESGRWFAKSSYSEDIIEL